MTNTLPPIAVRLAGRMFGFRRVPEICATLFLAAVFLHCLVSGAFAAVPSAPALQSPGGSSDPGPFIPDMTPTMKWSAPSGATGYGLYISRWSGSTWQLFYNNESIGSQTSFTLPADEIVPGARYRWNMRAKNSSGWGTYSSRLYFQTLAAPTILAPGVTAAPGVFLGTARPTFRWNEVSGADGYRLYIRKKNSSGVYNVIFDSDTVEGEPLEGDSYTLPSNRLTEPGEYRWNMSSHNSAGYGGTGERLYFQFDDDPPDAPTIIAPGELTAHGPELNDLTPTFTWNERPNADGYRLYIRKLTPDGDYDDVVFDSEDEGGPLTGSSYKLPANRLVAGERYRWNMSSHSHAGYGEPGGTRRYFQTDRTPLPAPTINSPGDLSEPGPTLGNLTPTFRWNSVTGADGYRLYIRTLDGEVVFDSENVEGEPITGTSYTLDAGVLEAGEKYRWSMSTHSGVGYGTDGTTRRYFQTEEAELKVTLTTLNGGETLQTGVGYTIRANVTETTSSGASLRAAAVASNLRTVLYEFSNNAGQTWQKIRSVLTSSNSPSTSWVPTGQSLSCKVRVTVTREDRSASDASNSAITVTPPPVPTNSDVTLSIDPVYRQGAAPWGVKRYDNLADVLPKNSIGQQGCAMTCLSMAMGFSGLGSAAVSINPDALNDKLKPTNGFVEGGGVFWGPAVTAASRASNQAPPTLVFEDEAPWKNSKDDSVWATDYLEDAVCVKKFPVIVGVIDKKGTRDGHYVLVRGKVGGRFIVLDPDSRTDSEAAKFLDSFPEGYFSVRGYVAAAASQGARLVRNSQLSEAATESIAPFSMVSDGNVDLLLVDSNGNQTGRAEASGGYAQEIPSSLYTEDTITALDFPVASRFRSIIVKEPEGGSYQLTAQGLKDGPFAVQLSPPFLNDFDSPVVIYGDAAVGSARTYELNVGGIANLEVSATMSPAQNGVGDTVALLLSLRNSGSETSQYATVTAVLPKGFSVVSVSSIQGVARQKGDMITWAIDAMGAGATASLTVNGIVTLSGDFKVTATAAAFTKDSDVSNNFVSTTATIVSAYRKWKIDMFGDSANDESVSGDEVDFDKDGMVNVFEYKLGRLPTKADVGAAFSFSLEGGYLSISTTKNPKATDVVLSAESSGDLSEPTAWSESTTLTLEDSDTHFKSRDTIPITDTSARFLRLRITRPIDEQ